MGKNLFAIFSMALLALGNSSAQTYYGEFREIYFQRESSASAEATGKSFLINNRDAFSASYNPSFPSLNKEIGVSYTGSKRLEYSDMAYYSSFALSIPLKKSILSFSHRLFDGYPEEDNPKFIQTIYNFNLASEVLSCLHIGAGISYTHVELNELIIDYYSPNIGFLFVYDLNRNNKMHTIYVSAALNSFLTYSSNNTYKGLAVPMGNQITYPQEYKLAQPQTCIINLGYLFKYHGLNLLADSEDIALNIQGEYSDILNSKYFNKYSLGTELEFLELFTLRIGYYSMDYRNFINEQFTYGYGFKIPFYAFSPLPLTLGADYTNLKQESEFTYHHFKNFNSFTITANYKL